MPRVQDREVGRACRCPGVCAGSRMMGGVSGLWRIPRGFITKLSEGRGLFKRNRATQQRAVHAHRQLAGYVSSTGARMSSLRACLSGFDKSRHINACARRVARFARANRRCGRPVRLVGSVLIAADSPQCTRRRQTTPTTPRVRNAPVAPSLSGRLTQLAPAADVRRGITGSQRPAKAKGFREFQGLGGCPEVFLLTADAASDSAPDSPAEPAPDSPAKPAPDSPAEPAPESPETILFILPICLPASWETDLISCIGVGMFLSCDRTRSGVPASLGRWLCMRPVVAVSVSPAALPRTASRNLWATVPCIGFALPLARYRVSRNGTGGLGRGLVGRRGHRGGGLGVGRRGSGGLGVVVRRHLEVRGLSYIPVPKLQGFEGGGGLAGWQFGGWWVGGLVGRERRWAGSGGQGADDRTPHTHTTPD